MRVARDPSAKRHNRASMLMALLATPCCSFCCAGRSGTSISSGSSGLGKWLLPRGTGSRVSRSRPRIWASPATDRLARPDGAGAGTALVGLGRAAPVRYAVLARCYGRGCLDLPAAWRAGGGCIDRSGDRLRSMRRSVRRVWRCSASGYSLSCCACKDLPSRRLCAESELDARSDYGPES